MLSHASLESVSQLVWALTVSKYFTKWKFRSLDSYDFKFTMLDYFSANANNLTIMRLRTVDWDRWFYRPGLPPKPDFDTSMADVCYALADKWQTLIASSNSTSFTPSAADIEGWTSSQVVVFLEKVQLFETPLKASDFECMGSAYSLLSSKNVELTSRYYDIGMKAGDKSVLEPTTQLLSKVGRMKFVRPLYRQLNVVDRDLAVATFKKNSDFYHPICRKMVEKLLFDKGERQ